MSETTTAPATAEDWERLAVDTGKACWLLDVSRSYLMQLIYKGEIKTTQLPSLRSGKPYEHRIEVAELRAFLARHRTNAA